MIKRIEITNGAGFDGDLHEAESQTGEYVYFGDVKEAIEQAFMAGQCDCGVDPSYSSAQAYAIAQGL